MSTIISDRADPNKLLILLLSKKDTYVSGEDISREFGVTRSAIWKQMNTLRDMGYTIKSSPRLGYKLEKSPDKLFPEEIWSRGELSFLGYKIYYNNVIDSTNESAKRIAQEGAPHGTLVIAEKQRQGKGRLGRSWESPDGGIWFSIILRPDLAPTEAPKLTILSAVAVTEAIRELTQVEALIKWPNDILIDGKKVCGILTEMSAEMAVVNHIIVGMGVNVNNIDFPEEFKLKSTSLKIAKERHINRAELLMLILKRFEYYYTLAEAHGFRHVFEKWRTLCGNLGKAVRIIGRHDSFEGIALDIDKDGALLVKRNDGKTTRVLSGDVSLR